MNAAHAQNVSESENLSDLKDFHKRLCSNLVLCGEVVPADGGVDSDSVAQDLSRHGGTAAVADLQNKGFFSMCESDRPSGRSVKVGRGKNVVLFVQYPGAWQILAARAKNQKWRRERDSNPRSPKELTRFRVARLQPTQPSLRRASNGTH